MHKIALCLHGLFDSSTDSSSKGEDGYNHIKHHILDKNDVDIFIHSWDTEKRSRILELYNPVSSVFEPQKDFSSLIKNNGLEKLQNFPRHPRSIFSHFYSIQKSFEQCFSYDKQYDIYIKARFDLGRINRNSSVEFPVQCINFNASLDMNLFHMADWPRFNCGPADMWFYSGPENMEKFCSIFNYLKSVFVINSDYHKYAMSIENNYGDISNSIIYYKYFLEKKNLWMKKNPLKCTYE